MRFGSIFLLMMVQLISNFPSSTPSVAEERCVGQIVCPIGSRGYHALEPENWDGKTKLPVLLHFHGWKRQGTVVVKHSRIAPATQEHGFLLIAPNGLNRSWDFWEADTDDVPFALAVLKDAQRRWPIDTSRIYVSGYSWGSSMAWRLACQHGDKIAGILAISGTLSSQYEKCPTGPVDVRHVHGLKDNVLDYPFGPNGEKTHTVRLWLDKNGCADGTDTVSGWSVTDKDQFTRHAWENCNGGKPVRLDIHQRGHFIPSGWIDRQLRELSASWELASE